MDFIDSEVHIMDKITHAMRQEKWKAIIQECNNSGMNKRDWLAAHNINPKTFYQWQRKLRMEIGTELALAQNNALAPVKNRPDFCQLTPPVPSVQSKAVITAGNLNIGLSEDISDEFLLRILRAVSHV